jgi:DNA-binding beta-propeller fold protein YncE
LTVLAMLCLISVLRSSPPSSGQTIPPAAKTSAPPSEVGCSTKVAPAKALSASVVRTASVPGRPTGAVATANGRWAFASLSTGGHGAIEVLSLASHVVRPVRSIPIPELAAGFGTVLTHDGRWLVVAGYNRTAVVSVPALETGKCDPLVGLLSDSGSGQFEVAVSSNDEYVFVSDETTGAVSVFDLARALSDGFDAPGVAIGMVPLAPGAVGVALSPNGALLYATTFGAYGPHGRLWVINAARAERGAGPSAVLAKVSAGCQPVRVEVAPGGRVVWVTALQSDALLGYDAASLLSRPSSALRTVVPVGSEPVGLSLVDNGQIALVANSNRGLVPGSTGRDGPQVIDVVDTARRWLIIQP